MKKKSTSNEVTVADASHNVRYDLIGKLVAETKLTRSAIAQILRGMRPTTFEYFKRNPEEFIIKAGKLIEEQKATAIVEHIAYKVLDDKYSIDVFTEPTLKNGMLGSNAIPAERSLYNYILTDSKNERQFAKQLDTDSDVAVYVKLPNAFLY